MKKMYVALLIVLLSLSLASAATAVKIPWHMVGVEVVAGVDGDGLAYREARFSGKHTKLDRILVRFGEYPDKGYLEFREGERIYLPCGKYILTVRPGYWATVKTRRAGAASGRIAAAETGFVTGSPVTEKVKIERGVFYPAILNFIPFDQVKRSVGPPILTEQYWPWGILVQPWTKAPDHMAEFDGVIASYFSDQGLDFVGSGQKKVPDYRRQTKIYKAGIGNEGSLVPYLFGYDRVYIRPYLHDLQKRFIVGPFHERLYEY